MYLIDLAEFLRTLARVDEKKRGHLWPVMNG